VIRRLTAPTEELSHSCLSSPSRLGSKPRPVGRPCQGRQPPKAVAKPAFRAPAPTLGCQLDEQRHPNRWQKSGERHEKSTCENVEGPRHGRGARRAARGAARQPARRLCRTDARRRGDYRAGPRPAPRRRHRRRHGGAARLDAAAVYHRMCIAWPRRKSAGRISSCPSGLEETLVHPLHSLGDGAEAVLRYLARLYPKQVRGP
jgi:hypothetical protein